MRRTAAIVGALASLSAWGAPPEPHRLKGGPFFENWGPADTQAPVVNEVRFKSSLTAGKPGRIQFKAKDDVSGISDYKSACGVLSSPSGASEIKICGKIQNDGGDWYSIEVTPDRWVEKGEYKISEFSVQDKAGNTGNWQPGARATTVRVLNPGTPDTKSPVITDVAFMNDKLSAGTRAKLAIHAKDDLSGIANYKSVCSDLLGPTPKDKIWICGKVEYQHGDYYTIEFEVPRNVAPGKYRLPEFTLTDNAGHTGRFTSNATADVSNPNPVKTDAVAPIIREVRADQTMCGPDGGGMGKLYFRVSEEGGLSPIKVGCDDFISASGKSRVSVCGALTTYGDNWYSIDFSLSPWLEEGSYALNNFTVEDRAGNKDVYPRTVTFVLKKCQKPGTETPIPPSH